MRTERPYRGTIERYYRTVADRFEIHPDLFMASGESSECASDIVRTIIRDTEAELVRVFESYKVAGSLPSDDELPVVMRVSVRGTPEEIRALRAKLEDWHKECSETRADREESGDLVSWSGLLAFYPE